MRWQFRLINHTVTGSSTTIIDEPVGWAEIKITIKRDIETHGVFFDFSLNKLGFHGTAYTIIKNAYDSLGIDANTELKIEAACDDNDAFEEVYTGKLVYPKTKFIEDDGCMVEIPLEQTGCVMAFRNRFDQKVDLNSLLGFDGSTPLIAYDKLPENIDIPGKNLPVTVATIPNDFSDSVTYTDDSAARGFHPPQTANIDEFETLNLGGFLWTTPPTFGSEGTITLSAYDTECSVVSGEMFIFSKINVVITCAVVFASGVPPFGVASFRARCIIYHTDSGGTIKNTLVIASATNSMLGAGADSFTLSGSNSVRWTDVDVGDKIFFTIVLDNQQGDFAISQFDFVFDKDQTLFRASIFEICPDTPCEMYLINEALSRASEIITNNCLRVYSDYFGRVDAEPYPSDDDGCGSLEAIANGLKIRRIKLNDGTIAPMSVSMKELMGGLNPIHNIGYGIETDPNRSGFDLLRVEPAEYFYGSSILLTLDGVKEIERTIDINRLFSLMKAGYKKWETEHLGGLDEHLTKREYRTETDNIEKTLNIESLFIASTYAIEVTRRISTTEDSAYDNEIFIFILERVGYTDIQVEVFDGIEENLISIGTNYNVRISPVRNLMRWFKTIAATWSVRHSSANKQLIFSSGEGNFIAGFQFNDYDDCLPETQSPYGSTVLYENESIDKNRFKISENPIWHPELIKFDYPLSWAEFNLIKANPTGKIRITHGGETYDGWIIQVDYEPNEGMAKWTLLRSYE